MDDIDRLRWHKDIIILSGDLSGIESYKSYKILNQILKCRDKKIIWLPGNHDNITDMIKYLKDFPRIISMALQNWSVITLDTSQPNSPVGYIHADELQMLERQLVKMKDKFIISKISPKKLRSIFSYSKHFKNVNLIFRRVFK